MKRINSYPRGLDTLQKISVSLMAVLVLLTFVGANLHALLWQQSSWLVSTVLPAVVVNLTNEERQQNSAPELRRNTKLDEAASLKAKHMAENEYFAHHSPDGVSPWHWFKEAGYVYAHAGENLAIHFTDSSEVVDAWMRSPTHRENIVNEQYTEIGVGTAKGTFEGFDTVYVVQLFGTPAVVPEPVSVQTEEPDSGTSSELAEISNSLNELALVVEDLAEVNETSDEEVVNERAVSGESDTAWVTQPTNEAVQAQPETNKTVSTFTAVEEVSETNLELAEVVDSPVARDVLVVESNIATSSGLAMASISETPVKSAGATAASIVTQPNTLLQLIYLLLGMVVMALLLFSALFEARQLHFIQVSYSLALMVSMGALWYVHSLLTEGAVIV